MRKYIALVLAFVCVIGLCACNSNNASNHGAAPEAYAFEAQYIRTNGGSENTSYPYHVVINSREELDAYYETNKELFDLERKEKVYSDTTIGFLDACDKYDDTYFERQNLVLIVLEEGSGSVRHEITDVRNRWDENGASLGWNITINRIVPDVATDDMAQWHLFLEVQMGDVIKSDDDVWINETLSNNYTNKLLNTGTGSSIQVENPNNGTDSEVRVGIWVVDFADGKSDNNITISTDDAKTLEEMLLSELWIDDLMDCVSDVTLTATDGRCLKYSSSNGIINDIDAHRCLILNDAERETFNSLLKKYGTLGGNLIVDADVSDFGFSYSIYEGNGNHGERIGITVTLTNQTGEIYKYTGSESQFRARVKLFTMNGDTEYTVPLEPIPDTDDIGEHQIGAGESRSFTFYFNIPSDAPLGVYNLWAAYKDSQITFSGVFAIID